MTAPECDVLVIEPYHTGSHAAWVAGYRRHSRHAVRCLTLPGRFWKWRMHGAAITLARRALADRPPDAIVVSDMLDLAAFLGLTRRVFGSVPTIAYFHENQLTYPEATVEPSWPASRRRRARRRDDHYAFINLTTALAADRVVWNSAYNRDAFLHALPGFLRRFPDCRELGATERIADRSQVVPVGLELDALRAARPSERRPGPPRIVWNHRWEHDKDPEAFAQALLALDARDVDFQAILVGESFVSVPPAFERLTDALGDRILHRGYVEDRSEYVAWLWRSDVCVSTARHEFFGVAVCEAIYCANRPVLPRRLAYPEIFAPDTFPDIYYEDGELETALGHALAAVERGDAPDPALAARVQTFAWPTIAAALDALIDDVVSTTGRAGA